MDDWQLNSEQMIDDRQEELVVRQQRLLDRKIDGKSIDDYRRYMIDK